VGIGREPGGKLKASQDLHRFKLLGQLTAHR
jgi:hypothetical protein